MDSPFFRELSLDHLYLAFRQAKTALFFDDRGVGLIELAAFEADLERRLKNLLALLQSAAFSLDEIPLGTTWMVPKKAIKDDGLSSRSELDSSAATGIDLQARLTPSPELAILEVLYLWRFGPAIERIIPKESIGYRLQSREGRISRTKRFLFDYWPNQYQRFRTEPLEAAERGIVESGHSHLFVTDFSRFYDNVCPKFLLNADFQAQLCDANPGGKGSAFDVDAFREGTESLLSVYSRFQRCVSDITGVDEPRGVPIGSLTSRVVANAALATLDGLLASNQSVLCYRRYVDDIAVVFVQATSSQLSREDAMRALLPLSSAVDEPDCLDANELRRDGSVFRINQKKTDVKTLRGKAGAQFLQGRS